LGKRKKCQKIDAAGAMHRFGDMGEGSKPEERIFPITYSAARIIVIKAGKLVDVDLRPHDLRRHATTYASRAEPPSKL